MENIKLEYDAEGNAVINRKGFAQDLAESIIEEYGQAIQIVDVTQSGVTLNYPEEGEDAEDVAVNLDSTEVGIDLKALIFILVACSYYRIPKVAFHVNIDDEGLEIVGVSLMDFSGVMYTHFEDGEEYTHTVVLGARYLLRVLQEQKAVELKQLKESRANKVTLIPVGQKFESDSVFDLYPEGTKFEDGSLAQPTLGSVNRDVREKKLRLKARRINRAKDAAGYRERSRAAKLRWKRNRSKIIRGMKKFYNSAEGKKTIRIRNKKLALQAGMKD